jgi:hypothetical protein
MNISWKNWKLRLAVYALATSGLLHLFAAWGISWHGDGPVEYVAKLGYYLCGVFIFSGGTILDLLSPHAEPSKEPVTLSAAFEGLHVFLTKALWFSFFLYWGFVFSVFYAIAKRRLRKLKLS